jgi:hypothetical protein
VLAPIPESDLRWTDPRLRGAWWAILAAALVALVFLPKSITNNDEYYYAGEAYTLAHGRLTPQPGDPLLVPLEPPAQAFRYPVAWPAVLALGRLVSLRGLYIVALLVHLSGAAAVARMLVRRGAPSALTVAYLFHPAMWIYSRTLLSDIPATAALLIAMDAWENRATKTSSVALGFCSAVRLANVTTVAGFLLSAVGPSPGNVRRRFGDLTTLVLGVAAFFVVQMLVNHTLGNYWLVSTYAKQGAAMFTGSMIPENVLLYVAGLALLPPFSLVFALARPRRVDRWALLGIPVLLAYLPISFHNVSPSLVETLVGGQRYILPVHATLLVATAGIWSTAPMLGRPWLPIGAGVIFGVVGCLLMTRLEKRHGAAAAAVAACHPDVLGYNMYANRVAGSVEARTYRLAEPPYRGLDADVLVIAPGLLTNQPGASVDWATRPPHLDGATCRQVGDYVIYDFSGRCPPRGDLCRPEGRP